MRVTAPANRCFEAEKRSRLLICMHNEPSIVAAMCIGNEDRSPLGIHGRDASPN
jgi:hypothetical protein